VRTGVVSYSLTGNNEALARGLAEALGADHIGVMEKRRRSMGTIMLDMLFGRTPVVRLSSECAESYELLVFVGPVWMGKIASPLRGCFRQLGSRVGAYAFVSISGGADGKGSNSGLTGELTRLFAKEPTAVVDMHTADFLPQEPKPKRKDTSAYRLTRSDVKRLVEKAEAALTKLKV